MNRVKFPSRISLSCAWVVLSGRICVVLLWVKLLKSLPNSSPIQTLGNIGSILLFTVFIDVYIRYVVVFKQKAKFNQIKDWSVVEIVNLLKFYFLSDLLAIALGLFLFFILSYAFKFNENDVRTHLLWLIMIDVIIRYFPIPYFMKKR